MRWEQGTCQGHLQGRVRRAGTGRGGSGGRARQRRVRGVGTGRGGSGGGLGRGGSGGRLASWREGLWEGDCKYMKLEGKPPRRKDGSCMAEWAEWHSSGRERDTRDKQKKTGPMTKWQGRVTGPESPPRTRRCALHRFPHWTLTPHPKAENPNPPAS